MLIEKTRTTFDPIAYPLASVTGGATKAGVVIDFDAKNQMVETNQVLEVYVSKAAEVGVTVEGETTTEHEPKLQIKIYSGDDPDSLSVVQSSEVFDADDLIEGFILYKAALPDKCGQYVRVDLVNPADDNDFAQGEVVGTVRPL